MFGIGIPMIVVGEDVLFSFTTGTFRSPVGPTYYSTNSGVQSNGNGPTQTALQTYYNSNNTTLAALLSANVYFKVPYNGYQVFTVPADGNYTIIAQGGTGGYTNVNGRAGCKLTATFSLTKGDYLWITIGQSGATGNETGNDWCGAGGGGATFVTWHSGSAPFSLSNVGYCMLCAAGGLGAREARFGTIQPSVSSASDGSSGTSFSTNFKNNTLTGGYGGYGGYYATGGFGGGTATDDSFGPAGGYDALQSISPNSYVHPSASNVTRVNEGDYLWSTSGYVTITKL